MSLFTKQGHYRICYLGTERGGARGRKRKDNKRIELLQLLCKRSTLTTELIVRGGGNMRESRRERIKVAGFEPESFAPKAKTLPLSYTLKSGG